MIYYDIILWFTLIIKGLQELPKLTMFVKFSDKTSCQTRGQKNQTTSILEWREYVYNIEQQAWVFSFLVQITNILLISY